MSEIDDLSLPGAFICPTRLSRFNHTFQSSLTISVHWSCLTSFSIFPFSLPLLPISALISTHHTSFYFFPSSFPLPLLPISVPISSLTSFSLFRSSLPLACSFSQPCWLSPVPPVLTPPLPSLRIIYSELVWFALNAVRAETAHSYHFHHNLNRVDYGCVGVYV